MRASNVRNDPCILPPVPSMLFDATRKFCVNTSFQSGYLEFAQSSMRGGRLCIADLACLEEPVEECSGETKVVRMDLGSVRDHKPDPSERKSGMPDGEEMPAPVSTTMRFAWRNNSAASSIAATVASVGAAAWLIWGAPRARRRTPQVLISAWPSGFRAGISWRASAYG